jgi:hypothetical protein
MAVRFITSITVVTSDPDEDRQLFVDALGLPLTGDDDYVFSEELNGSKHFAVCPSRRPRKPTLVPTVGPQTDPSPRPLSNQAKNGLIVGACFTPLLRDAP